MGAQCNNTAPHSNITNLSQSYRLSITELEAFQKGLTFIPTPNGPDRMGLRRDLHTYHRRLKLLDYFSYQSDFPSRWEPKTDVTSPSIQTLIRNDVTSFNKFRVKPTTKFNLTIQQLSAIKNLANNPHIIIKPADKGSQIVIMDKIQYLQEANRQLNNTLHYTPLYSIWNTKYDSRNCYEITQGKIYFS